MEMDQCEDLMDNDYFTKTLYEQLVIKSKGQSLINGFTLLAFLKLVH